MNVVLRILLIPAKLGDLAAAASTFEQSLRHAEKCDDAEATVAIGKALTEIRGRLDAKAAVSPAAAPTAVPAAAESASTEETTQDGELQPGNRSNGLFSGPIRFSY